MTIGLGYIQIVNYLTIIIIFLIKGAVMDIKKILISFLCGLMFFSSMAFAAQVSSKNGTIYYTEAVTKADANSLMAYLNKEGFFSNDRKMEVLLDKADGAYAFKFVVKKGMETDGEYITICKQISKSMSKDVFRGKQVDIHLLDENAKTLRVVVGF